MHFHMCCVHTHLQSACSYMHFDMHNNICYKICTVKVHIVLHINMHFHDKYDRGAYQSAYLSKADMHFQSASHLGLLDA